MTWFLQNDTLRLEFDQEYGTLIGLTARASDWHILVRPDQGLSFQLLIERFRQISNEAGQPDFLFAGEGCYDREFA